MAKLLRENLLRGNAREYQLKDGRFVIVSRADTSDYGDEVMVFESDGEGRVVSYSELYCARACYGDDMSDEAALKALEGEE